MNINLLAASLRFYLTKHLRDHKATPIDACVNYCNAVFFFDFHALKCPS
jgi:hypothetical protein